MADHGSVWLLVLVLRIPCGLWEQGTRGRYCTRRQDSGESIRPFFFQLRSLANLPMLDAGLVVLRFRCRATRVVVEAESGISLQQREKRVKSGLAVQVIISMAIMAGGTERPKMEVCP